MKSVSIFSRRNLSLLFNGGNIVFLFFIFLRSFDGAYVSDFNFSLFYLDIVIVLFVFFVLWFLRKVKNLSKSWFDIFSFCMGVLMLILWGLGFFLFYQMTLHFGLKLPENIGWYLGAFLISRFISLPLQAEGYSKLRLHSVFIGLSLLTFLVLLYLLLIPVKLFFANEATQTHSALQMIGAILGMMYIFFTSIYVPQCVLTRSRLEQKHMVTRMIFFLLVAFGVGMVAFGIYIRFA